jgi:hypothetical protein
LEGLHEVIHLEVQQLLAMRREAQEQRKKGAELDRLGLRKRKAGVFFKKPASWDAAPGRRYMK